MHPEHSYIHRSGRPDVDEKREMKVVIHGELIYQSSFDPNTGQLVRIVEDNPGRHITNAIPELFTNKRVRSPSPETIDLKITDKCPMGCEYCYMDSLPDSPHADKEEILDRIKEFHHYPYQIAIGGGEPTIHPEFVDILKEIREMGTVPSYTTAGVDLSDEIIEATNRYCGGAAITYHPHMGIRIRVRTRTPRSSSFEGECMINCNMCGMSFRSGNAYRKHLLTMHKAWGEDVDENMIPSRVTEAFSIQCGPGWIDVFAKHASDLEKIVKDSPEQTCIFKNKFGRPRFTNPMGVVPEYYESQLQDILHDISEECRSTCETCGKDGERKRMSVTCGDHHECT